MAAISNVPRTTDLDLIRGDPFTQEFRFVQSGSPLSLPTTGWASQIRTCADGDVIADFTVDASSAAAGIIRLSLSRASAAQLEDGVWDLECTDPAFDRTVTRGKVTIVGDSTR